MKKIVTTIGLPYSGKSTLARKYKEKGYEIISRDDIIENILKSEEYYDIVKKKCLEENLDFYEDKQSFKIRNEIMLELLNKKLEEKISISDNQNFFYDATNLQKIAREKLLGLKEVNQVEIDALFLNVPEDELLKRAKKSAEEREGKFNEGALKNLEFMISLFENPEKEEREKFSSFTEINFSDKEKTSEQKTKFKFI